VLWGITDSNRLALSGFVLHTIMAVVDYNVMPISPFLQLLEFIISNSVEIIVFYHFEQLYVYFKRLLI